MRTLAIAAGCLALAGCATDSAPKPDTAVITKVAVAATCTPKVSPAPKYPDTDEALKAAPDLFTKVQLMVAGRILRIARERELQAAVDGCATPPPQ